MRPRQVMPRRSVIAKVRRLREESSFNEAAASNAAEMSVAATTFWRSARRFNEAAASNAAEIIPAEQAGAAEEAVASMRPRQVMPRRFHALKADGRDDWRASMRPRQVMPRRYANMILRDWRAWASMRPRQVMPRR